jgi:hypothetical protein
MIPVVFSNFEIFSPSSSQTPLHGSWHGRLEVCRFLVESKADVNAKDATYDPLPLYTELKIPGAILVVFSFF